MQPCNQILQIRRSSRSMHSTTIAHIRPAMRSIELQKDIKGTPPNATSHHCDTHCVNVLSKRMSRTFSSFTTLISHQIILFPTGCKDLQKCAVTGLDLEHPNPFFAGHLWIRFKENPSCLSEDLTCCTLQHSKSHKTKREGAPDLASWSTVLLISILN